MISFIAYIIPLSAHKNSNDAVLIAIPNAVRKLKLVGSLPNIPLPGTHPGCAPKAQF